MYISILALYTFISAKFAVFTKYILVHGWVSEAEIILRNGKFPIDLLHSHICTLFFPSFIHLCDRPVHHLSCLTLVFLSSRERTENTACHKLFGGLFLLPWQCVYNSSALGLYLFLKAPLIHCWCLVLSLSHVLVKDGVLWLWQGRTYQALLLGAAAL